MSRFLHWFILLALLAGISVGLIRFRQTLAEFNRLNEVYEPLAGDIRTFEPGSHLNEFYVRCVVNKPLDLRWQFSIPSGKKFALVRQGIMDGGLQTFENRPATKAHAIHSFEWTVTADRRGRAHFNVGSGSVRTTGTYDLSGRPTTGLIRTSNVCVPNWKHMQSTLQCFWLMILAN